MLWGAGLGTRDTAKDQTALGKVGDAVIFTGTKATDYIAVGGQKTVATGCQLFNPVLAWLLVIVELATSTWKSMSHKDKAAIGKGVEQRVQILLFNVLYHLNTDSEVNRGADEAAFGQIVLNNRIGTVLYVEWQTIDTKYRYLEGINKITAHITKSGTYIKYAFDVEALHDIFKDIWREAGRIAIEEITATDLTGSIIFRVANK